MVGFPCNHHHVKPVAIILPRYTWVFPKIEVPQNGWFIMENPIKMDDLGVPLFLETSTFLFSSTESVHYLTHPLLTFRWVKTTLFILVNSNVSLA